MYPWSRWNLSNPKERDHVVLVMRFCEENRIKDFAKTDKIKNLQLPWIPILPFSLFHAVHKGFRRVDKIPWWIPTTTSIIVIIIITITIIVKENPLSSTHHLFTDAESSLLPCWKFILHSGTPAVGLKRPSAWRPPSGSGGGGTTAAAGQTFESLPDQCYPLSSWPAVLCSEHVAGV